MYKIEKKASGYVLTFGGLIGKEEMRRWVEESRQILASETTPYTVIVDMRTLAPLAPNVQKIMIEGQHLYKERGMVRSSVIAENTATAMQFKRLAKDSGIYAWERYMDGSQEDCFTTAITWAKDGIDPDV